MFTGIITAQGIVKKIVSADQGLRFVVSKPTRFVVSKPTRFVVSNGDSINMSGVCSTVAKNDAASFTVHYMPETIAKTTVANWSVGGGVNLEQAATPTTMLSGHILSGHVDCVGRIKKISGTRTAPIYTISFQKQFSDLVAPKGSIALDGISLTVVDKLSGSCSVALIPYTLSHTTLGKKKVGDSVNMEFDLIAKYLKELLNAKKR